MSEYYVGLDIGTESVGWAATDKTYKIQKKNGKALWGVRLFDEAQTAAERRGYRTARRRYERRHQRLEWLRQAFSAEIAKVDPAFFQRMDESKFLLEDKALADNGIPLGRYTLFADREFSDRDYHRKYPTIYHLRKALITESHPFDVRLVYLALHHILKNRGHFLFGDMNLDDVSFENCYDSLKECLSNEYELDFELSSPDTFKQILTDRHLSTTAKKAALRKCSGFGKESPQLLAVIDLLAGATVKPSVLFDQEFAKEDDKGITFKGDFDSREAELTDLLNDDMQLVQHIKRLYDWSILDVLRAGEAYLSFAKIKVYEQHHEDLGVLKSLLRANKKLYKEMFRAAKDKLDNYPAYAGHGSANYRCDYDKFSTYAKKVLKALAVQQTPEVQQINDVISRFDSGSFLAMQTSKNNGVIPHQLHEQELQLILDNACRYLPFLSEKDSSGLTLKQRILEMLRFRIPYYVGPLNPASSHAWIVRSNEKITPWNFEQVVDLEKSAEKFITNMTATCSYIGEPVLPKDSLLYSRFVALNMINKICVNGHPISVETKQRIFNDHLLLHGKGTWNSIKNFMLSNGLMQKGDELSGIDKEIKITLSGYKIFAKILSAGNHFLMVEDIIKHIVLFGEDRKLLERWLRKTYGTVLNSADCDYIVRNRSSFRNWGNLSAEFLTEIKHVDQDTGELISIIDMLWQTNDNLMELLSSRYSFAEAVDAYRVQKYGSQKRTLDEVLKDSYASPGIRRAIHQAMGIITEVEKIMGGEPARVFVEVTRSEEDEKKRTVSRKRQLDDLYTSCKAIAPDVYEQLQGYDDAALRSSKLYLYFTQLGKCMYSGESIDLSRLAIDYDIDHIHPQMRVKDDSITNRVLVKKELNAKKGDSYPLAEDVRHKMRSHWDLLKSKGLISDEKYRRLTRNTAFTDDELSGFIARQLVETSQACKIVAELLRERYHGQDKVVYVKAKNVASFRQDQRLLPDGTQAQAWACKGVDTRQDPLFVKCREVNDFHHAKDAYLNIVVGNVYHTKFTRNPLNFVRGKQTYSLNRMFDFDVVRNGECAWKAGPEGTITTVRKMMSKNNILFTRYAYEAGGGLFDQMIVPKGSGQAMIKAGDPRMDIQKYGGYNKLTGAYFCLVEHTEKKKRVRSIEAVMLMHKALYQKDPVSYCQKILGLQEPKVLIKKIKMNSLFSFDGFRMHVSGRTGTRIIFKNANQLVISPEEAGYIKQVSKYLARCRSAHAELPLTHFDSITAEKNMELYALLSQKLHTKRYAVKYATAVKTIDEETNKFSKLSLYDQCQILMQILNLFNTSAASADLKLLCGKAGIGILLASKKLNADEQGRFRIIHQSITGFFEKEIDLAGDTF